MSFVCVSTTSLCCLYTALKTGSHNVFSKSNLSTLFRYKSTFLFLYAKTMTFSKHTPENLPTSDNSIQYVAHWKFLAVYNRWTGLNGLDPWTWNLRIISEWLVWHYMHAQMRTQRVATLLDTTEVSETVVQDEPEQHQAHLQKVAKAAVKL